MKRFLLAAAVMALCLGVLTGCLSDRLFSLGGVAAESPYENEPSPEPSSRTMSSTSGATGDLSPLSAKSLVTSESGSQTETASTPRKRVYSGNASVTVDDIQDTKAQIIAYVDEVGGYIEWVREQSVSMRVPAEVFQESFEWVLGIGTVTHKSVETYDVTAYYADLESRMGIATATRERLYQLLEQTEDVEERLKVLQEIRRLTEEIEGINNTLAALDNRIAYSRIVVDLESRISDEYFDQSDIPFDWIAGLNPLYSTTDRLRGRVRIDTGESFAVFDEKRFFRAENAVGVRLRIGTVENTPMGDTDFWQTALRYHLQDFYRESDEVDIETQAGVLPAVQFTSKDREPYFYLVGVHAVKRWLYVVEVFYPSEDAHKDSRATVAEALSTLELP